MTITTKAGLDAAQKSRFQLQFTAALNGGATSWKSLQMVGSATIEGKTVTTSPAIPAGWTNFANGQSGQNFIDYPALNSHIAAINCAGQAPTTQGQLCAVYDVVAAYGGADVASATTATIATNPTLTRPDANGTGLEILLYYSGSGSVASSATFTASYTNSSGTSGRTATSILGATTLMNQTGTVYPLALQVGDTGVQSVQSVTATALQNSAISVLLARRICDFSLAMNASQEANHDWIDLGLPEIGSSAALAIIAMASGNSAPASQMIELVLAHG